MASFLSWMLFSVCVVGAIVTAEDFQRNHLDDESPVHWIKGAAPRGEGTPYQETVPKSGRSLWSSKFFRKMTALFGWKKNNRLEKRISKKRPEMLPFGLVQSPTRTNYRQKFQYPKNHRIKHPYEFVKSKSTDYHKSKPNYLISQLPPYNQPKRKNTKLKDNITNSKPHIHKSLSKTAKELPVTNKTTSQLFPSDTLISKKTSFALKAPVTHSRIPIVAHYSAGDIFTIPSETHAVSIPISSDFSFKQKYPSPKNPVYSIGRENSASSLQGDQDKKGEIFDNASSFTDNILSGLFPKLMKSGDRKKPKLGQLRRTFDVESSRISSSLTPPRSNQFAVKSSSHLFLPSPKEGSIMDDAFQPIFVPSQSLDDNIMSKSAMKPMIIASNIAAPNWKEPSPPVLMEFL